MDRDYVSSYTTKRCSRPIWYFIILSLQNAQFYLNLFNKASLTFLERIPSELPMNHYKFFRHTTYDPVLQRSMIDLRH